MSFLENAKLFIPALSGLPVTVWDRKDQTLEIFEKEFCFLPAVQPLYTAKGMQRFFEQKKENRIYKITDALDTHVVIINMCAQIVILGPYTDTPWRDAAAKVLLAGCCLQEDKFIPYKIYRCSLPFVEKNRAEDIAVFMLGNMVEFTDLNPIYVDMSEKKIEMDSLQTPPAYDEIEHIKKRYLFESKIMEAVRQGNSDQVFKLFHNNQELLIGVRFLTNSLHDKIASAFAIRVLVRHAALQAGLEPVFVDALSQEYAQKMHCASDAAQLHDILRQYIIAFCQAVRSNQKNNYSRYVRSALQYIELHLSQHITVDELCRINHITRQYFSQLFKKETGKTVKQYMNQARCERAAELLESSSLPIQEIGQYVGYEDTNYFTRVFKKQMGISPQEYRKQKAFYHKVNRS